MSLLDLVFIVFFLSVPLGLAVVVVALALRRRALAQRVSVTLGAWVVLYFGVLLVVSLVSPRRVVEIGDDLCFDDWCVAVADVRKEPSPGGVRYTVKFRVSSRAKRRPQRALDTAAYLIDDQGRRYRPAPDASAVPFDVRLEPGQAVITTRTFTIPANAPSPALVVSHGGGFPGRLIIGSPDSFLHKPTVFRLEP